MSKRQSTHKNKRINESWRKPRGKHSKQRLEKKHAPAVPKAGRRTPEEERNVHPSGYREVLVHNTDEMEKIDPEEEAARIASKVGGKKREKILEKAEEEEIKVLNGGEEQ